MYAFGSSHIPAKSGAGRRAAPRLLIVVALLVTSSTLALGALASGTASGNAVVAQAQEFTATMELAPSSGQIGDTVTVTGSGYPADTDVDLVYHTVKGYYEIEKKSEYVGQKFEEVTSVLVTAHADQDGNLTAQFQVPAGFGGPHDIRGNVDGKEISQAGIMVLPKLSMSPSEGPIGTPIELKIEGVDLRGKVNTWQLLYDNQYMGYASAVTTDGVAIAQFRATGPVGKHYIQAWNNAFQSTPYLPWDTSPFRDIKAGELFEFNTTSDPGLIPASADDFSAADNPWAIETTYPGTLALSVDRGFVSQQATVTGSNLPPNTEVALNYVTMVGDRVSDIGFSEMVVLLEMVMTGDDGSLTYDMTFPDDLGGSHRVEAVIGDEIVAAVGFVIMPSVVEVTSTPVHAGDQIDIHLKGIGWTTYDNTYTVSWDNSQIGYVCGFSTNGDVVFKVTAVGEPGTHLIDLYPTIYEGQEAKGTYWVPQLTYAADHPGRSLPAIRLSVVIVE